MHRSLLGAALVLGLVLAASGPASATVTHGDSAAFGLLVDLEVFILPDVSVGPTPLVAGVAPAPYDLDDDLLAISIFGVEAGLFEVEAASNVDGGLGVRFADASAELKDLTIGFDGLFELEVSSVLASAEVTGDFGALVATGDSTLLEATLEVFGVDLFDIDLDAPANTEVFDALGITVIVNEQITSGDGSSEAAIEVNAIHIVLDTHFVSGDIILSHAEARLRAESVVPEPGLAVLLLAAAAALVAVRRRRA